ncbi:hypothetical protein BB559_005588 [Furculomyces boomerangus]|uniref:Uncharacterized protein n=1 Tax=Furculomyces boomerangus TaxID=61424 RepID=A0A2T9Y7Q8_9FUNG|nr:hypothetical protein BB559_005588 [Furculomyces boomerangus]
MVSMRSRLEADEIDNNAINLIINDAQRKKKFKKYLYIQEQFLSWCTENDIVLENFCASDTTDFVTFGVVNHSWSFGTIKNYKSLFNALTSTWVKSFDFSSYYIGPIMRRFKDWGDNSIISADKLTKKVC